MWEIINNKKEVVEDKFGTIYISLTIPYIIMDLTCNVKIKTGIVINT